MVRVRAGPAMIRTIHLKLSCKPLQVVPDLGAIDVLGLIGNVAKLLECYISYQSPGVLQLESKKGAFLTFKSWNASIFAVQKRASVTCGVGGGGYRVPTPFCVVLHFSRRTNAHPSR